MNPPLFSRRPLSRLRPGRFTLLLAGIAVLGTALVLAREVTYGVALSWDPINYISVARNLLAGNGFIQWNGAFYTNWAPLYPMILAAASLGVFDPRDVSGPVNAVIFGVTVFIAGRWLHRCLESRFLVLWGCLAVALALPLAEIAFWGLSRPAFILFTILALIQTDAFLGSGKRSALLWAAVFTALAWLTHYVGISLAFTVGLLLLFQHGIPLSTKLRRIAIYSLIALAPIGLWLLRNYLRIGEITGNQQPVDYSLIKILSGICGILGKSLIWNWPVSSDGYYFTVALGGVTLLALAAAVGYVARRARRRALGHSTGLGNDWGEWRPFVIFGVFVLAHLALLVVAIMLGNTWHGVKPRFLTPVYIPLLFAALLVTDRLLSYARARNLMGSIAGVPVIRMLVWGRVKRTSLLALIILLVLCLWLSVNAAMNAREIWRVNAGFVHLGLTGRGWIDSAVMQYVSERLATERVLSNSAISLYHHAGHNNAHPMERNWAEARRQIERAADGTYVVWLYPYMDRYVAHHYYNLGILRTLRLEPVAQLSDGVIFKVNRDYDSAGALSAEYAAIASGEPVIRSDYDVYLHENALIYRKEQCRPEDTAAKFFLHLEPVDPADLPNQRKQYGFDNRDFDFAKSGYQLGATCFAIRVLPDYDLAAIRTGQWTEGQGRLWEGEYVVAE